MLLPEEQAQASAGQTLAGVFHCFGGTPAFAAAVLDLGFHVGLGGTLTFKNSGVADIVKDVPLSQIVLETDAPFLAPVPHRGKRNEPAYTRLVAEKLAEVKGVSVEEVAAVTSKNARKLFGLSD